MYVCLSVCVCIHIFQQSDPIGRKPTNRIAKYFEADKRSLPIGRDLDGECSYWSG